MRKLVKLVMIDNVVPHDNADRLSVAQVGGWRCVIKKDQFQAGDLALYFEIDSMIPFEQNPHFEFLGKNNVREVKSVKYSRIKSTKLRGQISQGLLMPLDIFEKAEPLYHLFYQVNDKQLFVDTINHLSDFSSLFGVIKFEPPQPTRLVGDLKGDFPYFIRKTDQERCVTGDTVVITEDGPKCIKEVCETHYNGNIMSFNHETYEVDWGQIEGWGVAPLANNWLKIKTKSGKEITVTDDHRIYVAGKGYIKAEHARVGDMLITYCAQLS